MISCPTSRFSAMAQCESCLSSVHSQLATLAIYRAKIPNVFGCRSSWHLKDKVRILRSLQWGRHGFANLRHARMVCPEVWNCHHLWLDWKWSGNWLHPTDWRNVTQLKVCDPMTLPPSFDSQVSASTKADCLIARVPIAPLVCMQMSACVA